MKDAIDFPARKQRASLSEAHVSGPIVIEATAQMSGGGVYLDELIPRLMKELEGERFVVFGPPLKKGLASGPSNVTVVELHLPTLENNIAWPGIVKLAWRLFVFPVRAFRHRPKVIVSTANFTSPFFSILGIPTVLCVHNLTPFHAPEWYRETTFGALLRNRALRRLTIFSVKRAARVIAFSQYAKKILSQYVSEHKVEVIYHGSPSVAPTWRGEGSKTFLVVAHYFPYKRVEIVIQAIARLIQRTGSREVHLVVQGRQYDRRYFEAMEAVVRANNLDDCVTLGAGLPANELQDLYANSRALVFPSIGENCPITLLEAMGIGIPVIVADCPPLPEICGEAGEYFQEGNVEACARAIERLGRGVERCRELSDAGVKRAAQFNWEKCAKATAQQIQLAAHDKT